MIMDDNRIMEAAKLIANSSAVLIQAPCLRSAVSGKYECEQTCEK